MQPDSLFVYNVLLTAAIELYINIPRISFFYNRTSVPFDPLGWPVDGEGQTLRKHPGSALLEGEVSRA